MVFKNAYFHVDAVQAIGHLDVKFDEFEIDAMSITAHKFGGPKGVGALLVANCNALAIPTICARFSVPARRFNSCSPPS
jgi:cysteine desulfurase